MSPEYAQWILRELGYVLSAAAEEFKASRPPLRDQFSTAALQGLLASPHLDSWDWKPFSHEQPAEVAERAYMLADAMLKAREPATNQVTTPINQEGKS